MRIPLAVFAAILPVVAVPMTGCGDGSGASGGPTVVVPGGPGVSVLGGAGPEERAAARITVAAAADLQDAFTALEPQVEAACATELVMVYGSSGQLRTQVLAGAGYGLFLSADAAYPAEIAAAGLGVPGGLASYGVGRLALVFRGMRADWLPPQGIQDLTRRDIRTIAIANPDHAPYGRAAKEALERSGLYSTVWGRLVIGENVRQAVEYVQSGNADVGLVALSLVIHSEGIVSHVVDASLHEPITQAGIVLKGTGAELTGRCVLQFLLDPGGQEVLRVYGFEAVKP